MNRIFLALLINLFSSSIIKAQTHYYRLAKKVVNGTTSKSVSGGQFITFMADICYESNKNGIGVGHGTLQRKNNFSNSQFKVYMGKSYWDDESTFKFTSDLATLNVVTESGDIYLYKQTTAPANATTCSLIRKSSSTGGGGGGVYPVQPNYPGGGGGYNPGGGSYNGGSGSGGSSSSNSSSSSSSSRRQHDLCNGTGKCKTCNGTGSMWKGYGQSGKTRCPNCNGTGRCSGCNGTGRR